MKSRWKLSAAMGVVLVLFSSLLMASAQAASPAAELSQSTTHSIRIKWLQCYTTEDTTGADEAYIRVNGKKVWGVTSMNDGQFRSIETDYTFTGDSVKIQLMDEDPWYEPNDSLGVRTLYPGDPNPWILTFDDDDAYYEMEVAVTW